MAVVLNAGRSLLAIISLVDSLARSKELCLGSKFVRGLSPARRLNEDVVEVVEDAVMGGDSGGEAGCGATEDDNPS